VIGLKAAQMVLPTNWKGASTESMQSLSVICVRGITNAKERIMASNAKKIDRDVAKLPSIPKELVDLFLTGPMTGEAINEAGIAFKKCRIASS
jgi:hypothetical protein